MNRVSKDKSVSRAKGLRKTAPTAFLGSHLSTADCLTKGSTSMPKEGAKGNCTSKEVVGRVCANNPTLKQLSIDRI